MTDSDTPIDEQKEWFRHRNAMRPFWSIVIILYFVAQVWVAWYVARTAYLAEKAFTELQDILFTPKPEPVKETLEQTMEKIQAYDDKRAETLRQIKKVEHKISHAQMSMGARAQHLSHGHHD